CLLVPRVDNMLSSNYYDFEAKEFKSRLIGIDYRNYPRKAVDFVLKNSVPQNMYNDFNSGAYLIGRAYPARRVFIDGRTELYGHEFFNQYTDSLKGNIASFERIVDKYRIRAVLVTMTLSGAPEIAGYLYRNPQWKLVFFDQAGIIFLRDVPENQELIKRYRIDLSKYSVPRADLKGLRLKAVYPEPYIKRASLFNLLKEDELVILECREALRIMPNCAQGYHLIGKTYLRKTLYQDALVNLRSAFILSPGNVEVLLDLATCYSELEENKLSIGVLKKAIRSHKDYAPAYYRLGCVYLTMNNLKEAIPALNKATRYEPQNPNYHFKLAVALYESARRLRNDSVITKARLELSEAWELNKQYRDKALEEEIGRFLLQFKRVYDKK
ncbi:MAG: tetratricopeptide repeat protein, partial [Candidatus Omnitrophica bacterium]|nr:tetratricopeptide repeat protein [Candidatus Omnitrophota bacterium]